VYLSLLLISGFKFRAQFLVNMNQDNSRYLLYKDYESGLNNELMSIELAVGIAYLTNRKLIYYGTVGSDKQLKPIQGGKSY